MSVHSVVGHSKRWRRMPAYKYRKVARRLRRRRLFPKIVLQCQNLSFTGPKSGKCPAMKRANRLCAPANYSIVYIPDGEELRTPSARVVQGRPSCTEPGSTNRGKSGKSSIKAWNPKPAQAFLTLTLISALPIPSSAVHSTSATLLEPSQIPRARKRAYQRAVRRAQQHGATQYRGRRHTAASLQAEHIGHNPTPPFRRPTTSTNNPRLRVLNYNIGGLSTDAYDELLNHLDNLPPSDRPHVVTLQESHWRHDCEYSAAGWHVIHSAKQGQPKAGGIVTMISKHFVDPNNIQHQAPVPGRLMHVRLTLNRCVLDVINVYEKVASSSSVSAAKAERSDMWSSLDQLLKLLPCRNPLVMCGDFNTPLEGIEGHTGPMIPKYDSNAPADREQLTQIILAQDLVHLNSWTRSAKATYVSAKSQTLIDHVFCRSRQADSAAKRAAPQPTALTAWRLGGRHRPIAFSIPLTHPQALYRQNQSHKTIIDIASLV